MLAEFDRQLEWFSVFQKKILEENENGFREAGIWKKVSKQQQKIKNEIQKSKKEFMNFRENFIQHITSIEGPDPAPYPRALIEYACDKITQEYIKLMQDCIFPMRWEWMYEDYLKEKENTAMKQVAQEDSKKSTN